MQVSYAEGLTVDWTEAEAKKLEEIRTRPLHQRSITIRIAAIWMLLSSGLSAQKIASEIGMSPDFVYRIVDGRKR